MKIRLDVSRHCIQTATKRKYNQLISNYFKSDAWSSENTKILESEISLLKEALENIDFTWLRSAFPELRGGGPDDIVISTGPDNKITITINGRTIHATN